jgi:hypothetical protein
MANLQKRGKRVPGQARQAPDAISLDRAPGGPVDRQDTTRLSAAAAPPNPAAKAIPGNMLPGQPVRVWQLSNLLPGHTIIVAMVSGGSVWTHVAVDTVPGG